MAISGRRTAGLALFVGFLVWLFFVSPLVELGVPQAAAGLLAAIVVPVAVFRHRARADADGEPGTGSVWAAIPSWQYAGRHVESGGLTRDEQERAVEDVQDEAEERRGLQ